MPFVGFTLGCLRLTLVLGSFRSVDWRTALRTLEGEFEENTDRIIVVMLIRLIYVKDEFTWICGYMRAVQVPTVSGVESPLFEFGSELSTALALSISYCT